jgi:hypothetical protein
MEHMESMLGRLSDKSCKTRRMIWAGRIACMGMRRNAYRILLGNQKERDH